MDIICKECGEPLIRTTTKYHRNRTFITGVRYMCNTPDCPVIFAAKPRYGQIVWVYETRPMVVHNA